MLYIEAVTHTEESALHWDSEGYYSFGSDTWKNTTITTKFIYTGGKIGVIPRFDSEISYVAFTIGNVTSIAATNIPEATSCVASLDAYLGEKSIHLAGKEMPSNLIIDQTYTLKAIIQRTNYRIYLDDVLIFNVEYNGLNNGAGAVYATAGNKCTEILVEENTPTGWVSNVGNVNGSVFNLRELPNKDKCLYLQNPSATALYAKQDIDVLATKTYTLSFMYQGECTVILTPLDGTSLVPSPLDLVASVEWTEGLHTFTAPEGCTKVSLEFVVKKDKEASINNAQLENEEFPTSYIHNESLIETVSRDYSYITYPSKNNIKKESGSLSVWVKPAVLGNGSIFSYGGTEGISLSCTPTSIVFTYGQTSLHLDGLLEVNEWTPIVCTWRSDRVSLTVKEESVESRGMFSLTAQSDLLYVGHLSGGLQIFNGVLDDLIIFSKDIDAEYIAEIATKDIPNTEEMIFRATFDHAIGNFNKSIIEMTPAPLYGSPVLVDKVDGTSMRKVSFFDRDSGEYKTNNTEQVIYDGYSDFVKVAYDGLDTENFKIKVQDYTGALYGDPYRVEGHKVYLTLANETKEELKNQPLWVSYQPENAFAIDYNIGQPDSFRATIGKYDGQALTVTYEGNKYSTEKLATMIEMNPMLNPNHEGFLYITQTKQEVSVFRVKATPSDLLADGISEAIIVIEPLDSNGNFISNAKLEVETEITNSTVLPNYDPGSIQLRERAGRYMYKYRAPLMTYAEYKKNEVIDYINIKDRISGNGVQIPISLMIKTKYANSIIAPTPEEVTWERMAAVLLDVVMDYFLKDVSEVPVGLRDIIDFNKDGVINLKEIIWLNDYKLTQSLYNTYVAYLGWKALHE